MVHRTGDMTSGKKTPVLSFSKPAILQYQPMNR